MKSLKNMNGFRQEKHIIVFDKTESVMESIIKDTVSSIFLFILIVVSLGSPWWTLFTGLMAVLFFACKFQTERDDRVKKFSSVKELKEWAAALPEEETTQTTCNYFE